VKQRIVETTVTYLAVSGPPAHLPPMPLSPRLALMRAENIPLHYYRYLYRAVGAEWLWFERLLFDDEALSAKVHKSGVEVFVLYANGSPSGYYELDFSKPECANLVYFGITPEWTGMKIGPWFLGCAVNEAFSRGVKQLTVNTCTLDHPAALPLYQRLGFSPVRREQRRMSVPETIQIPSHIAARISP
jgi:GNAT superfamily N-acetyltransferase